MSTASATVIIPITWSCWPRHPALNSRNTRMPSKTRSTSMASFHSDSWLSSHCFGASSSLTRPLWIQRGIRSPPTSIYSLGARMQVRFCSSGWAEAMTISLTCLSQRWDSVSQAPGSWTSSPSMSFSRLGWRQWMDSRLALPLATSSTVSWPWRCSSRSHHLS